MDYLSIYLDVPRFFSSELCSFPHVGEHILLDFYLDLFQGFFGANIMMSCFLFQIPVVYC